MLEFGEDIQLAMAILKARFRATKNFACLKTKSFQAIRIQLGFPTNQQQRRWVVGAFILLNMHLPKKLTWNLKRKSLEKGKATSTNYQFLWDSMLVVSGVISPTYLLSGFILLFSPHLYILL